MKYRKLYTEYEFVRLYNEYLINHYGPHYIYKQLGISYDSKERVYSKKCLAIVSKLIIDYRDQKSTSPLDKTLNDALPRYNNLLMQLEGSPEVEANKEISI
jgi:hypothetical protein